MTVAIDLSGKVAVVTGAASGIGRASAILFAQAGASVVCADRAEAVRETAEAIKEAGGQATAVTMDAGNEADVQSLMARAEATYGGIDILYANAGISGAGKIGYHDTNADDWAEILRVNTIGPSLAIKYAAPAIIKRGGGSIICTASVAGLRFGAGPAAYSASKAGVISIAQTAAQHLSGTGVRVNAICPGLIETGMTKPVYDAAREKGAEDKIGQINPTRRGGEPNEIAQVALFLASDLASYVNGQAIAVDGGLSSSHPVARPPRSPFLGEATRVA